MNCYFDGELSHWHSHHMNVFADFMCFLKKYLFEKYQLITFQVKWEFIE